MSYEIEVTRPFERCIKDLKKKYPHVKEDLAKVFPRLRENPEVGDSIPGFEDRVWKLRGRVPTSVKAREAAIG